MQTWEANVRRVVPYTPGEQPDLSGHDQTEYKRKSISAGAGSVQSSLWDGTGVI